MRGGGDFASNTSKAGISDQPSKGTTANNRDTSAATILDPAPDAEARQATEEWNESAVLNAGLGRSKEAGRGPTWDVPESSSADTGAPQSAAQGVGGMSDITGTTTGYGSSSGNAAPGYVDAGSRGVEGVQKPKGRNIQEGGFDDDAPNASFNAGIGSKNDPSRLAERQNEERNAQAAADVGYERDAKLSGDGQYDVLGDEAV